MSADFEGVGMILVQLSMAPRALRGSGGGHPVFVHEEIHD